MTKRVMIGRWVGLKRTHPPQNSKATRSPSIYKRENYVSGAYFENKCKGGTKNLFSMIQVMTKKIILNQVKQ